MNEMEEKHVVVLIEVTEDDYKSIRPLHRNWLHNPVPPRSASVGQNRVVFHPAIPSPLKAVEAVTQSFLDCKEGLNERMLENLNADLLTDFKEKMYDYFETVQQFEDCAVDLAKSFKDLKTPIPLSERMLRVKECRESLWEYMDPLQQDVGGGKVRALSAKLKNLEKIEESFVF
ncbi:hypothetical protein MHBO_005079, partial [Bonamia ostreae]